MGLNFGQNLFPPRGEVIASFDFVDIANGLGYVNYYPIVAQANNGDFTYQLIVDENVESNPGFAEATAENFDTTEFKLPRVIKGVAYGSFAQISAVSSGSGSNTAIKIESVKLIHVNSGGTTDLTTSFNTPTVIETSTGLAHEAKTYSVIFNEIAETIIKKGDKIRMEIDINKDGQPTLGVIGCNPRGTNIRVRGNTITENTRSLISLPFKIVT